MNAWSTCRARGGIPRDRKINKFIKFDQDAPAAAPAGWVIITRIEECEWVTHLFKSGEFQEEC